MVKRLPISVVITSFNNKDTINDCVESAKKLTTDIIVVDNGSTDGTIKLVEMMGATLIKEIWHGYGTNKNIGNRAAINDWILSIDSDEYLSNEAINSILKLELSQNLAVVYSLKRLSYVGKKAIHFGEWSNDWTVRLFNKKYARWDDLPVHEKLLFSGKPQKIKGYIHHRTCLNFEDFIAKQNRYAELAALKYYTNGEKSTIIKTFLSPIFSFTKNYIFKLGFLDGFAGFKLSYIYSRYIYCKYNTLKKLYE